MTQLEENDKLYQFIHNYTKLPRSWSTFEFEITLRLVIQSIATQAVEEYKKELLEKLPETNDLNECLGDDCRLSCEGYNDGLFQVRNIISKPNI